MDYVFLFVHKVLKSQNPVVFDILIASTTAEKNKKLFDERDKAGQVEWKPTITEVLNERFHSLEAKRERKPLILNKIINHLSEAAFGIQGLQERPLFRSQKRLWSPAQKLI